MRRFTTLLCTSAIVLATAPTAYGQTEVPPGAQPPTSEPEGADVADDTGELAPSNEIVVSARRRDESVQDVPQTVNVVTAAQVEKLNLRSFQEIQNVVPGLTLTASSSFSSRATVRGVEYTPEASSLNPSVEFYLNDAVISSGFLFQSTFDFGQFELQRGPQGTLRGRAAPSGSIAVTTRRPDLDEVGAVFNGTITDLHARKVDGAFNIPVIADVLAVRVAGVIDNNRGNRVRSIKEASDPINNEGPYRRTKSIRGSVRFEPTDWAAFNFMYQSLHAEDHSFAQAASDSLFTTAAAITPIIRPFDRLSLDDQGNYGRQDHDVYIGNADFGFAGQKLSYVGSYNKQDFAALTGSDTADFYGNPGRIPLAPRTLADPAGFEAVCSTEGPRAGLRATTGNFFQCTHGSSKRQSHELRLASEERIAGIFDYVGGVFYDRVKSGNSLTQETPLITQLPPQFGGGFIFLPPNFGGPVNLTPITTSGKSTEKSAFANLTAHFLDDQLEISGGLRYIDYAVEDSIAINSVVVGSRPKTKDNATVYTGSVKYKITPDIMVYAQTGSSWRPRPNAIGNFSVGNLAGTGQTVRERQFSALPPERSKSYEIGAKMSFLNGRGRLNVSAYHQNFKNYPFRGPGVFFQSFGNRGAGIVPSVGTFNFISAVPVDVDGVEGEASFEILPRWSIGVNASYANGRIKNGTIACTDLDRNGIPDVDVVTPTLAQLQASLPPGENLNICTGINRRSLNSAKFGANVQSEFGFDLGQNVDAFVRGLATITGKTPNDPDNAFDNVGAYGLLNLYAGVRDPDGAWEITVFGKNILREREVLSADSGPLTTTFVTGLPNYVSEYRGVTVTAPREFGLTAKIALGSR